jgi:hypothetical protein
MQPAQGEKKQTMNEENVLIDVFSKIEKSAFSRKQPVALMGIKTWIAKLNLSRELEKITGRNFA